MLISQNDTQQNNNNKNNSYSCCDEKYTNITSKSDQGTMNMKLTIPKRRMKPVHIIPFDDDAEEHLSKRCKTMSNTEEDSVYALLALRSSSIKPLQMVGGGQARRCCNDKDNTCSSFIGSKTNKQNRIDNQPFLRTMKPVKSFERPLGLPPGLPRVQYGCTLPPSISSKGEPKCVFKNEINIQLL
jgi:hypothetical protein